MLCSACTQLLKSGPCCAGTCANCVTASGKGRKVHCALDSDHSANVEAPCSLRVEMALRRSWAHPARESRLEGSLSCSLYAGITTDSDLVGSS